ncbi:MAG TPA: DUF4382 domain-containing protein [Puia sp.]|nr:DUF4382 domain-containing protein [Puia sp.]
MKTFIFPGLRFALMLTTVLLATLSCQKNNSKTNGSAGQHAVSIFLTDGPSLSFDHVFIDIQKLEIKAEDSLEDAQERNGDGGDDDRDRQGETSGGWMSLPIRSGIYDILQFRNGLDTVLGSGSFSSLRTIRKVRLTLGNNNSVVVNGVSTPLVIGGNDNIVVIKFSDDFLSDNPADIRFSLDLDAGRSIRLHGDRLELKPEVKAFRREKAGSIEGRVLPAQAQAVVMAFNGADTATAKPEREGEFKIVGLKPGSYSVLVHATSGTYSDTTLTNVVVARNEDAQVGTITLHP